MNFHSPERDVPPDDYHVVSDDIVLTARLDGTLAVCLYDAVEESGALLHLRFIARGALQSDVTDRTLASDLLLLDRCITTLHETLPRTTDLQGKIAANVAPEEGPRNAAEAVLALVGEYLRDAGVTIVSIDVDHGAPRQLAFRPTMGQVRIVEAGA